jgi:hypothetical protein
MGIREKEREGGRLGGLLIEFAKKRGRKKKKRRSCGDFGQISFEF